MKTKQCFFLSLVLALSGPAVAGEAVKETDSPDFSYLIGADYDGSLHRTSKWGWSLGVEYGLAEHWSVEVGARTYSDLSHSNNLRDEAQWFTNFEWTAYATKNRHVIFETFLDIDGPSTLGAHHGIELIPGLKLELTLTKTIRVGAAGGAVLATEALAGNHTGYEFVALWAKHWTKWLPNKSDTLGLSLYGATDETPGVKDQISIQLGYEFDIGKHCAANFGIGRELKTPYPHDSFYLAGGLNWRF